MRILGTEISKTFGSASRDVWRYLRHKYIIQEGIARCLEETYRPRFS